MPTIDLSLIHDQESFHDVFAEALGFPDFYGRNMDAWIDCMTNVDDPDDTMTTAHVLKGGVLCLQLLHAQDSRERCPRLFDDLIHCAAFVNHRRIELGKAPVLVLAYGA